MGKKSKNDKFYTKEEIAIKCISLLNLNTYSTVIEPSAGSGSFSNNIQHDNLIALDLFPDNDKILKMNWFDYEIKSDNLLIIGNPPFGERNNLSKAFIKKSIELGAKTIAFILPDVYNKYTMQSVFPSEYRLLEASKLPEYSFKLNEEDYNVPCTFYIWDKSEGVDLRFDPYKYKTNDFDIVKKCNVSSDSFFIMGASPNTVKELHEVSTTNRGYYIKPIGKDKTELIGIFKNIPFKAESSVNGGVAWRNKYEILKNYVDFVKLS